MTRWRRAIVVVAMGGAVALAGCSDGDDGGGGRDAADEAEAEDTGGAETTAAAEEPDETTTTLDPRAGEAVATLTVPIEAERPDDRVTIDVQSLTVEGETMVLRFSLTPDLASEDDSTAISFYDVYDGQRPGAFIQLVDRVNLKEYSVIYDPPNHWTSDAGDVESLNGEPMYVFAVFAAPEDDIDVVDVTFRDSWPSLVDVPIER